MAVLAPAALDIQDIQFKLHNKFALYNSCDELRDNVNLLAVSSSRGVLFAAHPNAAEMKVMITKNLVDSKKMEVVAQGRKVSLPGVPNNLACNSSGNLLAINITQNGSSFLNIYKVDSFLTPTVAMAYNIRISAEQNVYAKQLLWNTVLSNNIAVVLSNGALCMYNLKDANNFELHTLDKNLHIQCGCWSPKGKQIVLGFPNGKLQQFKPDLTPAKTIACPPNVHGSSFDTIALHWLATYQFAVVFLDHGDEKSPALYIVNAPKNGVASYINYEDVCYSNPSLRAHQYSFTHVPQWNLLIVTSANGVEVGILGTMESNDAPTWLQYTFLDEARIEMPLSVDNEETYPMGFVLDTSPTHNITISEKQIMPMPMIHVLASDGTLLCFNFLNLRDNPVSLCSPPPPIADSSGQFRPLVDLLEIKEKEQIEPTGETSFAFAPNTAAVSTPAQQKDKGSAGTIFGGFTSQQNAIGSSMNQGFGFGKTTSNSATALNFGNQVIPPTQAAVTDAPIAAPSFSAQPSQTSLFGSNAAPVSKTSESFGFNATSPALPVANTSAFVPGTGTSAFSGFASFNTDAAATNPVKKSESAPAATISQPQIKSELLNKALYTVSPKFTHSFENQQPAEIENVTITDPKFNGEDIDQVINQIMSVQIMAFEEELGLLKMENNKIFEKIGDPQKMKSYTKRLNDLQEIKDLADDRDFELDLQNLRQALNECFAITAACRSKLELHKNPNAPQIVTQNNFDAISRRQLKQLQNYVTINENHLRFIQHEIDNEWEQHQDVIRRNSKSKMHIPCLESIYERMTQMQNMILQRRKNLIKIKSKIASKNLIPAANKQSTISSNTDQPVRSLVDNLADSILSMSIAKGIEQDHAKFTREKLQKLHELVQRQEVRTIKPQRPLRVGLNSEVIIETQLKAERILRERRAVQKEALSKAVQVSIKPNENISGQEKSQNATVTATLTTVSNTPTTTATPPAAAPLFGSLMKPVSANQYNAPSQQQQFSVNIPKATGLPTFGNSTTTTKSSNAFNIAKPETSTAKSEKESIFAGFGSGMTTAAAKPKTPLFSASGELKSDQANDKPFHFTSFGGANNTGGNSPGALSFGGFGADSNNAAVKPFTSSFNFGGKGTPTATSGDSAKGLFSNLVTQLNSEESKTENIPKTVLNLNVKGTVDSTASNSNKSAGASEIKARSNINSQLNASATTSNASAPSSPASTSSTATIIHSASNTSSTSTASNVDVTASLFENTSICKPTTKEICNDGAVQGNKFGGGNIFSLAPSDSSSDALFGKGFGKNAEVLAPAPPPPTITTTTTVATTPSSTASTFSFTSAFSSLNTAATKTDAPTASTTVASTTQSPSLFGALTATTTVASTQVMTPASSGGSTPVPLNTWPNKSDNGVTAAPNVSTTAPTFGLATSTATIKAGTDTTVTTSFFGATPSTTNTASSPFAPSFSTTTSTAGAVSPFGGSTLSTGNSGTSSFSAATSTSSPFGGAATTTATSSFGVATSTAASALPFGGGISTTTASLFGGSTTPFNAATSTATTATPFGAPTSNAASSTSGNLFGSIPKPEQSIFSGTVSPMQPPTGLFASAAAANPSFGGAVGGNTGSIFDKTATAAPAFNSSGVSSMFDSSTPFGANNAFAKPATDSNATSIFGGHTANPATGGSVFGQNMFGQQSAAPATGSNVFANPTQFGGSGNSLFGEANSNTSSSSIFGGGANKTASPFGIFNTNPSGFGSFSQPSSGGAFGGGGAFAQGGTSVAQTGFGSSISPQQQQPTAVFGKSVFGGSGTFSSPTPAFGTETTFGGAPTFGSPKGFSSFAATGNASPNAFATNANVVAPQQKNNLFEALGSSDTGLSFGNLAQSANTAKPAFEGSSFMNYRA